MEANSYTQSAALNECTKRNGTLASISNADENVFVASKIVVEANPQTLPTIFIRIFKISSSKRLVENFMTLGLDYINLSQD